MLTLVIGREETKEEFSNRTLQKTLPAFPVGRESRLLQKILTTQKSKVKILATPYNQIFFSLTLNPTIESRKHESERTLFSLKKKLKLI
jgi:hypothetical protein